MPKPKDRVQLTKQESSAGGGTPTDDSDFLNDFPLDSGQDAPDVAGVYIQESGVTKDKKVTVYRESGEMYFEDSLHCDSSRLTLGDLHSPVVVSGVAIPTQVGQVLYNRPGNEFTVELPLTSCDGWLTNDNGLLMVVG